MQCVITWSSSCPSVNNYGTGYANICEDCNDEMWFFGVASLIRTCCCLVPSFCVAFDDVVRSRMEGARSCRMTQRMPTVPPLPYGVMLRFASR